MASSDNLMTMMEPWAFRSTFNDAWFPEMFNKETENLTKVLQKSFSSQESELIPPVETDSPFFKRETVVFQTPSASGPTASGGSETETALSKRRSTSINTKVGVGGKKITKRKPRASKRALTTYITADVENFRQMVQQVTGVRNGHMAVASVLKPEPRRPVDRIQPVGCLPTLDTSAFLLDPVSSFMPTPSSGPPSTVGSDGSFGFDSFSGFPTLESWN